MELAGPPLLLPRLVYFRSGRTRFRSRQHLFKNSTEGRERDKERGSKQKEKRANQLKGEN